MPDQSDKSTDPRVLGKRLIDEAFAAIGEHEAGKLTNFTCQRNGMVYRKGGGHVGVIGALSTGDGWYWRTATRDHKGVARLRRDAIRDLIFAWDDEVRSAAKRNHD